MVYDLDGVITRRDSFAELLSVRLRRSPSLLLRATPALCMWMASGNSGRRAHAARRVSEIALAGMSDQDYADLASAVGKRIGGAPSWIRHDVIRRMAQQHSEGTRVVVATGTELRLAQALLAQAGVGYDTVIASTLEATPTGMKFVDHNVGNRKADALIESAVALIHAEFVTDSSTDLPTARLASRVVLVGATRRTRAAFARAGVAFDAFDGSN